MTLDPMIRSDAAWHVLLEDLAAPQTPDYLEAAIERASVRSQRPAWTFPGRWLPMIDIAVRPVPAARLPLRAIGAGLLILALLVALLAFVGSRSRVPPPFGPARNGLVTWAQDGDIFTGDPVTKIVKRVVASDDLDRNPVFSRDGVHIAFLRQVPAIQGTFDVVVVDEDGGGLHVVTPTPITVPTAVVWSPDGKSLLVNEETGVLTRYPIDGTSPQPMLQGVHIEPDAFRPPNGSQLLYERDDDQRALYVMDVDGGNPVQLFGARTAPCACALSSQAHWSPDGQRVAFTVNVDGLQERVVVIDADGQNFRRLADEADGLWTEGEPTWSPDGTRIAFNRWHGDDAGNWPAQAIGVVPSTGGSVMSLGVAPPDNGALIEWAPDGRSILSTPATVADTFSWGNQLDGSVARPTLIDMDGGGATQLDWSVGSVTSWQRK